MDLHSVLTIFTPAAAVGLVALLRAAHVDRRSLLLQMCNSLLEPEVQEGRRLIYVYLQRYPGRHWTELPDDATVRADLEQINRALALYDTAGWYIKHRYISKRALLENWAVSIVRCWYRSYEPYIAVRRERERWPAWSDYEWLAKEAERDLLRRGLSAAVDSARTVETRSTPAVGAEAGSKPETAS